MEDVYDSHSNLKVQMTYHFLKVETYTLKQQTTDGNKKTNGPNRELNLTFLSSDFTFFTSSRGSHNP